MFSYQRLGFCLDITSLSFYNPEDKHFLFHDIQISKGKPRMPQKIATVVDQTEEEIYYQIVPCGGVKQCPVENCTYITSTREHQNCTNHPDKELVVQNECQVEFVYVWPENTDDNRRWLSGLLRRSDLQSSNLHNHRLNKESKVPSKVVHNIQNALEKDQTLTTHDIMTGWLLVVIQFI